MFGLKQAIVDGKYNVLHNLQCSVTLYTSWTMHMFGLKQAVVHGKHNVLHNVQCSVALYACLHAVRHLEQCTDSGYGSLIATVVRYKQAGCYGSLVV